jgi:predicted DNA-binding antitoxin AbrB/MazE fold protein
MPTIRAIFENGVFRPLEPVDLPEGTLVVLEVRVIQESIGCNSDELYEILERRFNSGFSDTAARHNEHQP